MPNLRVQALKLLTRRDFSRVELRAKLAIEAETEDELDADKVFAKLSSLKGANTDDEDEEE